MSGPSNREVRPVIYDWKKTMVEMICGKGAVGLIIFTSCSKCLPPARTQARRRWRHAHRQPHVQ